jgi:hypothetical protein
MRLPISAFWLCLLLAIMSPIGSVAGGSDLAFNPGIVNLTAVVGTETASVDVRVTNVSGKTITIGGITQEGGAGFSEIDNCVARELRAGASCTMKVSFTPLAAGGHDHITNAIFGFDVAGTQVAYLDAHGQAI